MNFTSSEPAAMHTIKPQRGRPKGSGIDDRGRLQQIASLMAVDPRLKPTTAIKAIGITDPSTIRRLRDKLRAMGDDIRSLATAPPGDTSQSALSASSPAALRSFASARLQEQIRRAEFLSAPPPRLGPFDFDSSVAGATDRTAAARTEGDDIIASMAHMLAMGLVNMCNLMQHQPDLWQNIMKSPALALSLRQQLILSEMLLDAVPAKRTRQPMPAQQQPTALTG